MYFMIHGVVEKVHVVHFGVVGKVCCTLEQVFEGVISKALCDDNIAGN